MAFIRYSANPILSVNPANSWEAEAVFNASVAQNDGRHFLVYRAISSPQVYYGSNIKLSTIGLAESSDGINFENRRLFINPEYNWERFGCEDPRITKLGDKYYIFYTALSDFPHTAQGIKIGVAVSRNMKEIDVKHQVTHFNSKAMALFPEKIHNKITAILTINTDQPPAKICFACFDNESQLWSWDYWEKWLAKHDNFILPLQRSDDDHVEIGAAPIKTKDGWLLIYSYIKNYFSGSPIFGIEACLLDLKNPLKVLDKTTGPLLTPKEDYELSGQVPKVIFPSGALVKKNRLYLYYGAADTSVCLAEAKLTDLLKQVHAGGKEPKKKSYFRLKKYPGNPILAPKPKSDWESKAVLNAAAFEDNNKIHIVYRAMGDEDTSVLGYAWTDDGFNIKERLEKPIYTPREQFEKKLQPGWSGCEDPRITKINGRYYMCYTAFHGGPTTYVAFTSIKRQNFLNNKWLWTKPRIISDPSQSDKNACLFEEKIKGRYVFLHRLGDCIWIDFVSDLIFSYDRWLGGKILLNPRPGKWDSLRIGIAGPPHKTRDGWVLIYHGLSECDNKYRLGAALLDLKAPDQVLARLDEPILEPDKDYEMIGIRSGTVFSCGSVIKKGALLVYYGAADSYLAAASMPFEKLLKKFSDPKAVSC